MRVRTDRGSRVPAAATAAARLAAEPPFAAATVALTSTSAPLTFTFTATATFAPPPQGGEALHATRPCAHRPE